MMIRLLCHALLLTLLLLHVPDRVLAQIYENRTWPTGLSWQQAGDETLRILFPSGFEREAVRSYEIAHRAIPPIQDLVGGSLDRFPIILHSHNDQNNGFVSPVPFRSEIYLSPRRGVSFHPLSNSWLDQVIPHELVHALHYNHHAPGLIRWIRPFSPDLARSLHATAPSGMFEGIAVWAETELFPNAIGRGDHPFFKEPLLHAHRIGKPWTSGQIVHPTLYQLPFDRHYIGSWFWTDWLLSEYGPTIYRETLRAHSQWPLFGFGFSLRRSTGSWPSTLFREANRSMRESHFLKSVTSIDAGEDLPGLKNHSGISYRSPKWLSNHHLLYHRHGLSSDPALVIRDLSTHHDVVQRITGISEAMDLATGNEGEWYFSEYRNDPRYDDVRYLELFRFEPKSGDLSRLSRGGRMTHPLMSDDELYAFQNSGERNRLIRFDPKSRSALPILPEPIDGQFEEMTRHPDYPWIAIVARHRDQMGFWIVESEDWEVVRSQAPHFSLPNVVVRDLAWHPHRKELLFSSDLNGSYNLFHYDVDQESLSQWTHGSVQQLEPAWSPDGNHLAWVEQIGGRYSLKVDDTDSIAIHSIPIETPNPSSWTLYEKPEPTVNLSTMDSRRYRSGVSWVKPRVLLPFWRQYEDETWMAGLQLASTEILGRQTYHVKSGWMANHLWAEGTYRNSYLRPTIELELYRRPRFHPLTGLGTTGGSSGFYQLLTRRDGAALATPIQWRWLHRPYRTSIRVRPRLAYQDEEVFRDRDRQQFGENGIRTLSSQLFTALEYRIQQRPREMQPGAGWILFLRGEAILFSERRGSEQILFPGYGERSISAGLYRYMRLPGETGFTGRIGGRLIQQTLQGGYSIQSLLTGSYNSTGVGTVREGVVLEHRWTLPIWWLDRGGLLIPAHGHGLYAVLFGETILPTGTSTIDGVNSRTQLGIGLRMRGQWGRFTADFGVGWIHDWNRKRGFFYAGDF